MSARDFIPYLVDALNPPDSPYRVTISDLFLAWEGGDNALDLRATGVRLLARDAEQQAQGAHGGGQGGAQGELIAMLPEVSFGLSPHALLRGDVRLRSVQITRPFFHLHRDHAGTVTLGMMTSGRSERPPQGLGEDASPSGGKDSSQVLSLLVEALSNQGDGPLAELDAVTIVSAEALVTDDAMGFDWSIPMAALTLYRRGNGSVGVSAGLEVSLPSRVLPPVPLEPLSALSAEDATGTDAVPVETTTHMDVTGSYVPQTGRLSLDFGFAGLRPSELATLGPAFAPLAAVDLPLRGKVGVALDLTQGVSLNGISLQVEAGEGVVALAELGARYHVARMLLKARALARPGESLLQGPAGGTLDHASIDALEIVLVPPGQGIVSDTASPVGGPPVGAPTVTVTGTITRQRHDNAADNGADQAGHTTEPGLDIALQAGVTHVPVDALKEWWPQVVAPNPRAWVTEHLRDGMAETGTWTVALHGPSLDDIEPVSLDGLLKAVGVTVDYLPPLPAALDGRADVAFSLHKVDISILSAHVEQPDVDPLMITGGRVAILGIDEPDQMTEIDLDIHGALPAALRLLDSQPLGYTSKLGLQPAQTSGSAQTHLSMRFPPLADLLLEQIDVHATAELADVGLRKAVFGQDLDKGKLSLEVDTSELKASGTAELSGIPASFTWREVFSGSPYSSHYDVQATIAEDKRGVFGLTFIPFTPDIMGGPVGADVDLTLYRGGRTDIKAVLDLTPTRISIPYFKWHKAADTPASGTVTVRLQNGSVVDVPSFSVRTEGDFAVSGSVRLGAGSSLKQVILDQAQVGLSSFAGTITRQDGDAGGSGYEIAAQGSSFDLVPFLEQDTTDEAAADTADSTAGTTAEETPPLTFRGRFDKVWLSETGSLSAVQGQARRANGRWIWAAVQGQVGQGAALQYQLGSADTGDHPQGQRPFSLSADDTGALLKELGWLGSIKGGRLTARGTVAANGDATGLLTVSAYRLIDAPVLARILSVAALTGILDSLSGQGIGFDGLKTEFTLTDQALTVTDFQSSGPALGLTAKGRINLDSSTFDLAGTIVPAYAVNGLLGQIPLVGGLLTGFTEGGGLIAATYSLKGPTSDPDISVNPLSALAPGFLRSLFGFGEPGSAPEPKPTPIPDDPTAE